MSVLRREMAARPDPAKSAELDRLAKAGIFTVILLSFTAIDMAAQRDIALLVLLTDQASPDV